MTRTLARAILLTASAGVVALVPGAGAAQPADGVAPQRAERLPHGALVQLPGRSGCFATKYRPAPGTANCVPARGLAAGAQAVAISPDGRHVYVASGNARFDSALAVFRRRPDGRLVQPRGRAGCVGLEGALGCASGGAINGPSFVSVAPDGRHVFVVNPPGAHTVDVFARDRGTGALRFASCLGPGEACTPVRALGAWSVAVSPDGRSVYAAGEPGLSVVARDPVTGRLRQLDGSAGCVERTRRLDSGYGCAKPPVDQFVPRAVAVAPNGRHVYVTSFRDADPRGVVLAFRRDQDTGALEPLPGREACASERPEDGSTCTRATGLRYASALVVSPDGRSVYVGASALAVFSRSSETGALAQLAGRAGCVANAPRPRCLGGPSFENRGPPALVVSRDGRNLYVAAADVLLAFARNPATGSLRELPGRYACHAPQGTATRIAPPLGRGCTRGRGVDGVTSVAVSPDGRNVYAASFWRPAVAVFRRAH